MAPQQEQQQDPAVQCLVQQLLEREHNRAPPAPTPIEPRLLPPTYPDGHMIHQASAQFLHRSNMPIQPPFTQPGHQPTPPNIPGAPRPKTACLQQQPTHPANGSDMHHQQPMQPQARLTMLATTDVRQQILANALVLYPHIVDEHSKRYPTTPIRANDIFEIVLSNPTVYRSTADATPTSFFRASITSSTRHEPALRTVLASSEFCVNPDHALGRLMVMTAQSIAKQDGIFLPSLAAKQPLQIDRAQISSEEYAKAVEGAKRLRTSVAEKETAENKVAQEEPVAEKEPVAENDQREAAEDGLRNVKRSELFEPTASEGGDEFQAAKRQRLGMQADAIERWQKDAEEAGKEEPMEDIQSEEEQK